MPHGYENEPINPYQSSTKDYKCPLNCRDMSTHNFLLYSLMVLALGFFVGVIVGVFAI